MIRPRRLTRGSSTLVVAFLLCMISGRAPAAIVWSYPGLDALQRLGALQRQADAVVVVKLARQLPGEDSGRFMYSFWELKVLKNLKGSLQEGTTFAANLRFPHFSVADSSTTATTDAVGAARLDLQIRDLMLPRKRVSKALEGSVYLLMARRGAGLSQGTDWDNMHPLNNAEWSNLNTEGSLIPLAPDLPLHTDSSTPVTSQAAELIDRAWERLQRTN